MASSSSATAATTALSKPEIKDCICPVCLELLIEPVTMPCSHELCMPCFKQHVQETSLTCPICRMRISNWSRLAARDGEQGLINTMRWQQIRKYFPKEVRRRLTGKDNGILNDYSDDPHIIIAEPGEVRKEYEELLQRAREELRAEREKQEAESRKLIDRLEAEDITRLQVEEGDQAVAARLAAAMNESINPDEAIAEIRQDIEERTKAYSAYEELIAATTMSADATNPAAASVASTSSRIVSEAETAAAKKKAATIEDEAAEIAKELNAVEESEKAKQAKESETTPAAEFPASPDQIDEGALTIADQEQVHEPPAAVGQEGEPIPARPPTPTPRSDVPSVASTTADSDVVVVESDIGGAHTAEHFRPIFAAPRTPPKTTAASSTLPIKPPVIRLPAGQHPNPPSSSTAQQDEDSVSALVQQVLSEVVEKSSSSVASGSASSTSADAKIKGNGKRGRPKGSMSKNPSNKISKRVAAQSFDHFMEVEKSEAALAPAFETVSALVEDIHTATAKVNKPKRSKKEPANAAGLLLPKRPPGPQGPSVGGFTLPIQNIIDLQRMYPPPQIVAAPPNISAAAGPSGIPVMPGPPPPTFIGVPVPPAPRPQIMQSPPLDQSGKRGRKRKEKEGPPAAKFPPPMFAPQPPPRHIAPQQQPPVQQRQLWPAPMPRQQMQQQPQFGFMPQMAPQQIPAFTSQMAMTGAPLPIPKKRPYVKKAPKPLLPMPGPSMAMPGSSVSAATPLLLQQSYLASGIMEQKKKRGRKPKLAPLPLPTVPQEDQRIAAKSSQLAAGAAAALPGSSKGPGAGRKRKAFETQSGASSQLSQGQPAAKKPSKAPKSAARPAAFSFTSVPQAVLDVISKPASPPPAPKAPLPPLVFEPVDEKYAARRAAARKLEQEWADEKMARQLQRQLSREAMHAPATHRTNKKSSAAKASAAAKSAAKGGDVKAETRGRPRKNPDAAPAKKPAAGKKAKLAKPETKTKANLKSKRKLQVDDDAIGAAEAEADNHPLSKPVAYVSPIHRVKQNTNAAAKSRSPEATVSLAVAQAAPTVTFATSRTGGSSPGSAQRDDKNLAKLVNRKVRGSFRALAKPRPLPGELTNAATPAAAKSVPPPSAKDSKQEHITLVIPPPPSANATSSGVGQAPARGRGAKKTGADAKTASPPKDLPTTSNAAEKGKPSKKGPVNAVLASAALEDESSSTTSSTGRKRGRQPKAAATEKGSSPPPAKRGRASKIAAAKTIAKESSSGKGKTPLKAGKAPATSKQAAAKGREKKAGTSSKVDEAEARDRLLALKLQQQFDKEAKQLAGRRMSTSSGRGAPAVSNSVAGTSGRRGRKAK